VSWSVFDILAFLINIEERRQGHLTCQGMPAALNCTQLHVRPESPGTANNVWATRLVSQSATICQMHKPMAYTTACMVIASCLARNMHEPQRIGVVHVVLCLVFMSLLEPDQPGGPPLTCMQDCTSSLHDSAIRSAVGTQCNLKHTAPRLPCALSAHYQATMMPTVVASQLHTYNTLIGLP
jgi:hypothetical protein